MYLLQRRRNKPDCNVGTALLGTVSRYFVVEVIGVIG